MISLYKSGNSKEAVGATHTSCQPRLYRPICSRAWTWAIGVNNRCAQNVSVRWSSVSNYIQEEDLKIFSCCTARCSVGLLGGCWLVKKLRSWICRPAKAGRLCQRRFCVTMRYLRKCFKTALTRLPNMIEKILVRWKAGFFFCSVAFNVLIVFFVSSGEITSNFKQQMLMISNSKNQSADFIHPFCAAFDRLSFSAKNTTRKNCSVSVFKRANQTEYYSINSSSPLCTRSLFKKYYRTNSAFMAEGYWDILTFRNRIKSATFLPPFCSFTRPDLDLNYIRKCFLRRKIKKIVMLGDSIGKMTFTGVMAVLASSGIRQCEVMKAEEDAFITNISYYLPHGTVIPPGYVNIDSRPCHSCDAEQLRCFYKSKNNFVFSQTSIVFEFLPLNYFIDSSVRIVKPIAGFRPTNYTQEFLFRDYLGSTGQPDVVIIVAPFLHEVRAGLQRHGKAGLKGMIRNLVTILNKYLPKSTQVYWVPSHYVFGGTELEPVRRCNQDLFDALKTEFGAVGNRMHGTLDLLSLSCPLVELRLSYDYYHMQAKFYKVIGKHLLELLCN